MKVSYKGIPHDVPSKLRAKLDAKFGKLSKLLERRGEREAHVVLTQERHLHNAEITVQFYDHQLVGTASNGDLFTAMSEALEKLEKQALRQRGRFREKGRRSSPGRSAPSAVAPVFPGASQAQTGRERGSKQSTLEPRQPRIYRVDHHERRKPITIEEAVLHMEDGRDYLVYRDAHKECVSVLVRRKDGHFDLVEI